MKIIPCNQGDAVWHRSRLGLPTASEFSRILTPTGKPSAQVDGYMHALIAERILDAPIDSGETPWMLRGSDLEDEAIAYYVFAREMACSTVGFCTTDSGTVGCSPDRLVGEDGGLEIKCPSAAVHVGYLLDNLPRKFWPQVQGCMMVTGRKWWDLLSYNPELPPALVRIERDEDYIAVLGKAVAELVTRLDQGEAFVRGLMRRAA